MSEFKSSAVGMASSALRAASNIFGGFMGGVSSSTYEIERAVQGPGHDKAFRECIEETKPYFHQCPRCSHWVCVTTCWNEKRMLATTARPTSKRSLRRRKCRPRSTR